VTLEVLRRVFAPFARYADNRTLANVDAATLTWSVELHDDWLVKETSVIPDDATTRKVHASIPAVKEGKYETLGCGRNFEIAVNVQTFSGLQCDL